LPTSADSDELRRRRVRDDGSGVGECGRRAHRRLFAARYRRWRQGERAFLRVWAAEMMLLPDEPQIRRCSPANGDIEADRCWTVFDESNTDESNNALQRPVAPVKPTESVLLS
jgi:hypothetical protein